MINPSFRELSEISSSRYEICIMVMKRARLLTDGSKPKMKSKGKKPVTVALDEIMDRQVKKKEIDAQTKRTVNVQEEVNEKDIAPDAEPSTEEVGE